MKKYFYITTPIYYASGNLHIGHLYTTTLAWVIANYKKLMGYEVKMLTGSDEHGLKIQQKAKENNQSEQIYVDQIVEKFKILWKDLDINYDFFSRTSDFKHKEKVHDIFEFFLKENLIYKNKYEGLYSVNDEEFLTKIQAIERDGKFYHPTSNHELEWVSEESYFFKMSQFTNWLLNYIDNNKDFISPEKIKNEIKNNFLSKGLEDLSLSRTNVTWGIKVQKDPKHTLYVWLDALCNYITALDYDIKTKTQGKLFNEFWTNKNTEVVHLIGKEITRFHAIYWPIFLHALNLKLPTRIQSHGWIITPTGKMSKSKNNVVNPYDLLKHFHPEMIKYFFSSQISLGEDGVYEQQRFIDTINADLVNNFGNLVSRTLKMISNSFNKPLNYVKTSDVNDLDVEHKIINSIEQYIKYFDNFQVDKALKVAINLSSSLNKYIDLTQPWTLKNNLERLEQILNRLLHGIYACTFYLSVVMPQKCNEVLKALNLTEMNFKDILNFSKFNSVLTKESFILFNRIKL
ncbi:methionine--tRNA ligase [Mycoplasmopsis cricetuli]|uniref:methionine--tRNA ligase n=1 Tax=Mycoplasmopsis cricetuli TaxID=171283 RepID=UPI0004705645|nr:methionine--tRNA ligase [Mycoplasmopsis cricetuli]